MTQSIELIGKNCTEQQKKKKKRKEKNKKETTQWGNKYPTND